MRNLVKINFKIIFLSPIIYLYYMFISFFFLFFIYIIGKSSDSINYSFSLDLLAYLEIAIFILTFCISVYCIQQKHLLEDICYIPRKKTILYRMFTLLLSCSLICLLPITYMMYNEFINGTSFIFMIMSLIYFLIRWTSFILISLLFGGFFGLLVQSRIVYLIAAPLSVLFSHLNVVMLKRVVNNEILAKLSNLLSLQRPFIHGLEVDYASPRIDLLFLLKFLVILFLSGLIVSLIYVVLSRLKRFRGMVGIVVSGMLLIITSNSYLYHAPIRYQYIDKIYHYAASSQDAVITDYSGQIKLSEYSHFNLKVNIEKGYIGDLLTFRLDNAFIIDAIVYDNKTMKYTRNNDLLTLSDESLRDAGEYTIDFSYQGRIQYVSDIDGINIYTSYFSSALPPNFAFIPLLDGSHSTTNYDLVVNSFNTVISNVNTVHFAPGQYYVNGTASSICLFSGFFDSDEYNGMVIYKSMYNFQTDYISVYDDSMRRRFFDPRTQQYYEKTSENHEKVFMIYYLYGVSGAPVEYDGYIMINYGFPY